MTPLVSNLTVFVLLVILQGILIAKHCAVYRNYDYLYSARYFTKSGKIPIIKLLLLFAPLRRNIRT